MKISKNLLESVFESKIKEFMSIDSNTLYIKWDLTEEEINAGITKQFYIYYSELVLTLKDWAFKNGYAMTSGINKNILNMEKSKEYYDNFYIAEIYGFNARISDTGVNELEAVQQVALRILDTL